LTPDGFWAGAMLASITDYELYIRHTQFLQLTRTTFHFRSIDFIYVLRKLSAAILFQPNCKPDERTDNMAVIFGIAPIKVILERLPPEEIDHLQYG
jgi:hypothetical protein